jgi:uncharacterized membrane protein (DUF485 family)
MQSVPINEDEHYKMIAKTQNTFIFVVRFIMFNVSFNNISVISWRSGLLVEETGGPGENHQPVLNH